MHKSLLGFTGHGECIRGLLGNVGCQLAVCEVNGRDGNGRAEVLLEHRSHRDHCSLPVRKGASEVVMVVREVMVVRW